MLRNGLFLIVIELYEQGTSNKIYHPLILPDSQFLKNPVFKIGSANPEPALLDYLLSPRVSMMPR